LTTGRISIAHSSRPLLLLPQDEKFS